MKSSSAELAQHLAGEVTTLATLWKVKRRDGQIFGFTDHDRDIAYDDGSGDGVITYLARSGYTRTAIQSTSDLAVDNLDVETFFDAAGITEEDLRAGLWDHAEACLMLVNRADLGQGHVALRRGFLGEVTITDGSFACELRGLTQALQQTIGEVYTPDCRADLGDVRCKVELGAITQSTSVDTVTDNATFTAAGILLEIPGGGGPAPNGFFDGGLVTFTSGDNAGISREVKAYEAATGTITLFLPMPFAIDPGDAFDIYPGCDKRLETCIERFDNVLNFRGEPFVPGQDRVLRYPDASY